MDSFILKTIILRTVIFILLFILLYRVTRKFINGIMLKRKESFENYNKNYNKKDDN